MICFDTTTISNLDEVYIASLYMAFIIPRVPLCTLSSIFLTKKVLLIHYGCVIPSMAANLVAIIAVPDQNSVYSIHSILFI